MTKRGRPRHPDILTPREWEVLDLLREGLSNAEIGDRLDITERTAKYHVAEILSKLDVDNRAEAAAWRPEEHKPWWLAMGAPVAFLLRRPSVSWVTSAISGAAIVAALGGLAFLAFLLVTSGSAKGPLVGAADSGEVIAFSFRGNIYAVRPDGSDLKRVIGPDNAYYSAPEFSPDGTQLAYIADHHRVIVVDSADPANVRADIDLFLGQAPPTPSGADSSIGPTAVHWSPDGELLLVTRQRLGGSGSSDVMLMNPDGTDQRSIIESGTFIEATWHQEPGDPQITVGTFEDGTSHFFDLEGRDVGSGLGGEETASAWLYWPEHNGAMVRKALGNPTPFGSIRLIDMDSNEIVAEGCGATWSSDGERIAFYDGQGLVIQTPETDGDSNLIVLNTDLIMEEFGMQPQSPVGFSFNGCFGLGITWTAETRLTTRNRALDPTFTTFSAYSDDDLGISFDMPDTWRDGAPWMPYASCVDCLVIGPMDASPPFGIYIFQPFTDVSGPDCGGTFGGCPVASWFSIRVLPWSPQEPITVDGHQALEQRLFRQPPLGLTNDTGELRLYREIATEMDTEAGGLLIVGFYREDNDAGKTEVEAAYKRLLETLVVE